MAPTPGGGPWQMTHEKHNCYFHANDMGCLRQLYEVRNAEKVMWYNGVRVCVGFCNRAKHIRPILNTIFGLHFNHTQTCTHTLSTASLIILFEVL